MTISQVMQNQEINQTPAIKIETQGREIFSNLLSTEIDKNKAEGKADIVSGRIGIDYEDRGMPHCVSYFDKNGEKLTTSPFNAEAILKMTDKFNIPLEDLKGLGEQLDQKGIGYKPYELNPGTGSNHGIDFDDLIAGGLGTAYDWTEDKNIGLKGLFAQSQLEESKTLAKRLSLSKNSLVTTEMGIDQSKLCSTTDHSGDPLNYVASNSNVASWYKTQTQAEAAKDLYGGSVISFTPPTRIDIPTAVTEDSTVNTDSAAAAPAENTVPEINTTENIPQQNDFTISDVLEPKQVDSLSLEKIFLQLKSQNMALYQQFQDAGLFSSSTE